MSDLSSRAEETADASCQAAVDLAEATVEQFDRYLSAPETIDEEASPGGTRELLIMATKKTGRPRGRPKEKPGDKVDLAYVARLCRQGATDAVLAAIFGVTQRTIDNWKKDPDFLSALKGGKAGLDHEILSAAARRAIGYDLIETKTEQIPIIVYQKTRGKIDRSKPPKVEYETKITTTTKHIPPDPTSFIWWMNNRDRDNWPARTAVELSGTVNHKNLGSEKTSDLLADLADILFRGLSGNESENIVQQVQAIIEEDAVKIARRGLDQYAGNGNGRKNGTNGR